MILRLVDQPLAEAHKDHVQWTPRSGACSRGGASAVGAQAQAQALCDQQHGAFLTTNSPHRGASAWPPPILRVSRGDSARPSMVAALAGSTLDQAPVAKAAVLRHDFHFVRGEPPRSSRSVPLLLLSHGCQQLDDLLEH